MAETKEVSKTSQGLSVVCQSDIIFSHPGDDVVLSCHLNPAVSAASMEIQWWHKQDPVFLYKNRQVTVNIDFEGRVSLPLQNLQNGNLSLTLRDIRSSQKGLYICEVTHESQSIQDTVFLHISYEDFRLVTPVGTVSADPGSDVILPVHLSPETSAVSLDIRWFRGTELIYHYMNRKEKTNYENRVSLSIQKLETGNLALTLRNFQPADSGDYTCKVFHDGCLQTGIVHLQVREIQMSADARLVHLHNVLRKVQKDILQHKGQVLQETLNLLQETLYQYEMRNKAFGPTLRHSNSMEGIPPFMKEEDMHHRHKIVKRYVLKRNIFRKRSLSLPISKCHKLVYKMYAVAV
ncbi:butyrophilin-like protein 2 [Carassius carassius]|uniref:butyrophilin-like protein 2 n=1 Tax=Carassius carassius TaxID=217509 RepID=UPI0028693D08|nr:butyrophilin-like protein 2 [Carassius carassius]